MRRPLPALLLLPLAASLAACSASAPRSAADSAPVPAAVATTATPSAEPSPSASPRASASSPPAAAPSQPAEPAGSVPSSTPAGPEDPLVEQPALESAPPVGLPTCEARTLTMVDADALVTRDAVQEVFVLRTTGPDCQLEGFPQLELRAADGSVLRPTLRRGGYGLHDDPPEPVTLSRATSASFVIASGRRGDCVPLSEARATLPGTGGQLRAETPLEVCDDAVGVTPVRRSIDDHADNT